MSEAINKIAILSSAIKHALLADVQFMDGHVSSAFNRKMKGIITPGIYGGFAPELAGGLNLKITSLHGPGGHGVASVDVNNLQITVQQIEDVILAIPVNGITRVMLEANYQYGVKTNQIDGSSDIPAARIFTASISEPVAGNHLELCRLTVPADATELTLDMIDLSHRRNKALGITLSSEIDSDDDHVAASSHAVKKAVKAANDIATLLVKELVGGAPAMLDTLKKIADAINNDPHYSATVAAALAQKAPLNSPALTGIPTAPTAPLTVNNSQIATTAFVNAAVAALVGSSPEALDTLSELAKALGNDPNFATTITNQLAKKQPLDATLTALAALATGANKLPYFTGADTVAQTDFTQVARDILAKSSIADVIKYLGLSETIEIAKNAVPATRKINGHVLSGDVNVTSPDIFNGQCISIGVNQNLNNYTTPGLYAQAENANTSAALNYPENNAGSLVVLKSAGVTQIYCAYNSSRIWSRSQYNGGPWTPWARGYNTQNKPTSDDVNAIARDCCHIAGFSSNNAAQPYMRHTTSNAVVILATQAWANGAFQPKGNYTPNGQSYTKGESDGRYNLKNTASLGQNGWERDGTTGRIRQWGYTNQTTGYQHITFPIAFPNGMRNIQVTPFTSNVAGTLECSVSQYSNTGARLNANQNFPLFWEATGN